MQPVDLFYSYAHEDEALRDELAGHLKIMERRGVLRAWHDRQLVAGQAWDKEISQALENADLILLLVSSDFMNSDYIWGHELAQAIQRHQDGNATVIPILVRSCMIDDAPFAEIQGLPTDMVAVTSWPNRDEAWTDVAKGIRRTAKAISERQSEMPAPMPTPAPAPAPSRGLERTAAPAPPAATWDSDDADHDGMEDAAAGATEDADVQSVPQESAGAATDPTLDRLLSSSAEQLALTALARGSGEVNPADARRTALELIDIPEQKRILWVDDRPANNRNEIAWLAHLQIEVVCVTSTTQAMERLAADPEPFDLIISDWKRDESLPDAPSAAVALLRELQRAGHTMPVVIYHGASGLGGEMVRRSVVSEGAVGATARPDELFSLIASELAAD